MNHDQSTCRGPTAPGSFQPAHGRTPRHRQPRRVSGKRRLRLPAWPTRLRHSVNRPRRLESRNSSGSGSVSPQECGLHSQSLFLRSIRSKVTDEASYSLSGERTWRARRTRLNTTQLLNLAIQMLLIMSPGRPRVRITTPDLEAEGDHRSDRRRLHPTPDKRPPAKLSREAPVALPA